MHVRPDTHASAGAPHSRDAGDLKARLDCLLGMWLSEQFDLLAENTMHDRWTYTNPRKITGPADIRDILRMAA